MLKTPPRFRPPLEPDFLPASLWCEAFRRMVRADRAARPVSVLIAGDAQTAPAFETQLLSTAHPAAALNHLYLERLVKFLLWQRGGHRVRLAGVDELVPALARTYGSGGARAFDAEFMGGRIYGADFSVAAAAFEALQGVPEPGLLVGRNVDGCRIGFDLGGTSRKVCATIDGRVVFSEAQPWEPYFHPDPDYHLAAVRESLWRAAAHLPRVDAIGGSSAGVFVGNEMRVSALFRGVPPERFEREARRMFFTLQREWGDIPFAVANDGDVAALAGSMALGRGAVLGLSMGTSQAAGYVTPAGNLTPWLNELAFAPVEFRADAPRDEWSGDRGCGAQYFSQQAIGRWAERAGFSHPPGMPLPVRVRAVATAFEAGDPRAAAVYETVGICLGYAVAHYATFYDLEQVLVLGGVASGEAGALMVRHATAVLGAEFPHLAERITLQGAEEGGSRFAQAIAAASLPMAGNVSAGGVFTFDQPAGVEVAS